MIFADRSFQYELAIMRREASGAAEAEIKHNAD